MPTTIRKRSSQTLCGLPLYDIALGPNLATGETRGRARGIVAIGDSAVGWLAVGGLARGGIAVGGAAFGIVSVGGFAVGLIGLGGFAMGLLALGGAAIAVVALGGGAAVGVVALSGGVAIGSYAYAPPDCVAISYHATDNAPPPDKRTPDEVFAAQDAKLDKSLLCDACKAGGDAMKRYFLIRHNLSAKETPKEYGLLLILPGGPGSADFLPFCANVLTLAGTPKDFIVAELVAPAWSGRQAQDNVWPSKAFPSPEAKFTSEEFIDAVISDVSKHYKLHPGWVFTLGWSSSGHVIYSSSFENKKIRGCFVAMSRFVPEMFAHPENATGKRYYFWHSPDDAICPYAESKAAAALLTKHGASTIHKSYKGGHGWMPFTFYGDRIHEALDWFRASDADADKVKARITATPESPH